MRRLLMLLLVVILAGGLITACGGSGESLSVTDAWARPAKAGANSAIYLNIRNGQAEGETLLQASCPAAGATELHISKMDANGNMMMEHQDTIPIAGRETVKLEPGGLHIMLIGLNEDLEAGQKVPLTLTFEKSGKIELEAEVREP